MSSLKSTFFFFFFLLSFMIIVAVQVSHTTAQTSLQWKAGQRQDNVRNSRVLWDKARLEYILREMVECITKCILHAFNRCIMHVSRQKRWFLFWVGRHNSVLLEAVLVSPGCAHFSSQTLATQFSTGMVLFRYEQAGFGEINDWIRKLLIKNRA